MPAGLAPVADLRQKVAVDAPDIQSGFSLPPYSEHHDQTLMEVNHDIRYGNTDGYGFKPGYAGSAGPGKRQVTRDG